MNDPITVTYRLEMRTKLQIKDKLTKNKAIFSKADKGHSIINLYQEEYKEKISSSLTIVSPLQMATSLKNYKRL